MAELAAYSSLEQFNIRSHINYFRTCLKVLPEPYTSIDTSRITAIYFAVIGLDVLGGLQELSDKEKEAIIEFIYQLQVRKGPSPEAANHGQFGFIGGTFINHNSCNNCHGLDSSVSLCSLLRYHQGHIAMTYTALATLITLGDDLSRVHKDDIVLGIKTLQTAKGSFEAMPSRCSEAGGESDVRFLFCVCAISAMLNDWRGVDKDRAVQFIKSCVTYEGGIAVDTACEAQGGATYCALASLVLMERLQDRTEVLSAHSSLSNHSGYDSGTAGSVDSFSLVQMNTNSAAQSGTSPSFSLQEQRDTARWCLHRQGSNGYQGRTNKQPDSCYSFWVGASLELLGEFQHSDIPSTRSFLLCECQQNKLIGGFSKFPDCYPDILHTFYSICWMSIAESYSIMTEKPQEESAAAYVENTSMFQGNKRRYLRDLDVRIGICRDRLPIHLQ